MSRWPKFKPWKPIDSAPKDGTEIEGRGHNWGDKTCGMHRAIVYWDDSRSQWCDAYDEDLQRTHLIEWRSYENRKHQ